MPNRIVTRAAFTVFATLLLAAPARAAEVVEVRVGNHPTYTRVVFELDAPAGYRIERHEAEDGVSEILVTVDAGSTPRSVDPKTVMVDRIAVQDGLDHSTVRIRLRKSPSRVRELILANPPRLVFDLVFPEPMLLAAKRRAADEPAAAPKPIAKPTPQPIAKVSEPVAPAQLAKPMVVQPKAAPKPAPAQLAKPVVMQPKVAPKPAAGRLASASAGTDWPFYGSIAGAVILLGVVLVVWLRRRSLPNDVAVTALAEQAGADDPREAAETSVGSELSEAAREAPRTGPEFAAGPGIFDEDDSEKENETMDVESPDLPMERTATGLRTTRADTGPAAAAGGSDMARLFRDLERRVVQLEARLDESSDARERLERQVAAQAEELRVQRAAIARTQRALRSMSRSEDDQATEPALREGGR